MAVLCEAISIVIKEESISNKFVDGMAGFIRTIPNATFCSDGKLTRVGFMSPEEVEQYIKLLIANGLNFNLIEADITDDIAVIDQQRGPTRVCEWIEFGRFSMGDNGSSMAACWLIEGKRVADGLHLPSANMDISTPEGWNFEGSLSQRFRFVDNSLINKTSH